MAESDVPGLLFCIKCQTVCPKENFYRYRNNAPHQWCKGCVRQKAVVSQHRFKLEAIAYKGGVCVDCERMPHPAAMTFHHLDPSQKNYQLSAAREKTLSEAVKRELDKCVLLCRNCHAIRHVEYWNPGDFKEVGRPGVEPGPYGLKARCSTS